MRISVDVGGTFTDVTALDQVTGRVITEKVETTPANPAEGVLRGVEQAEVALTDLQYFVHGTTLGLNAILTRTGARTAIVTTRGFRDIYEIGRASRDPMYDFKYRKPKPLVPRHLIFEVTERVNYRGEVLTPLEEADVVRAARRMAGEGVQAVAVCLLHSYANPAHERRTMEILLRELPGVFVTLSHDLTREYREYERTSTTVIDAYVKPVVQGYLFALDAALRERGFRGQFLLMRSGGGAMTLAAAKDQPVHLVHSGPAGGVIGGAYLGDLMERRNLITMDMGGTSLDTSLIVGGHPGVETEARIEGLPVALPMIDIRTIGAGGGSIAWIDEGGHLQVGPQSAGAMPGPACYGKGGRDATVTDAAIVIGYLDPHNFLGGSIRIQPGLARQAVGRVAHRLRMTDAQAAGGIVRISEAKITGAIRQISVERGFHPKDFALLAFGGGGGFVATNVAREVGIPAVIVPLAPAHFSAWGMLMVDVVHDFAQTSVTPVDGADLDRVNAIFTQLQENGEETLSTEGFEADQRTFLYWADMRYTGQEHAVRVAMPATRLTREDVTDIIERFNEAHEMQYGHRMSDPVEMVTLRIRAMGLLSKPRLAAVPRGQGARQAAEGARTVYRLDADATVEYMVYDRIRLGAGDSIRGPAIIEESSATIVLHPDDHATVGPYGQLVIEVGGLDQ